MEDEEEFAILSLTNKSTETLSVPVISVSWEAVTDATKYQVQFSISSSFDIIYGTRVYSTDSENLTTSTDIDYLKYETGTGDFYNVYLTASTTYYVRVRAEKEAASGWTHITPGSSITKSATPTSLSVSFSRTDRILPTLSANWSAVGESDKYRLRLYHLTYNQDGEEPDTITTWEPFTHAGGQDDHVYIEINGGINNSVTDLTGFTLLDNDEVTTYTQTFLDTVDSADNMLTKIAFAVRARQTRSDSVNPVFFPFYPTYDANNGSFSPGTIYNTVPTSITFTTAPTVTESSEGLSVNFNDGITDATDYKVFVSTDSSFTDGPDTYTSEVTAKPASDFGDFGLGTNTFYYVKYEAGINDNVTNVTTYYPASGNDVTYLSLAAAPSLL